ncbi:MAG: single-stranded DNA-binding protein [Clostridia bacterium]|nr:single-stranded DNA-binding protein [Clostridia bacterium]
MNKVVLIGNLTRDPELTTTTNGVNFCRFTIAVSRNFATSDGEREADFLPIIAWRAQADNCYKYLKKGSKVAVVGSVQTRNYEANDGTRRYVTEIVADNVEFISTKNSGTDSGEEDGGVKPQPKEDVVSKFEPIDDDNLPF